MTNNKELTVRELIALLQQRKDQDAPVKITAWYNGEAIDLQPKYTDDSYCTIFTDLGIDEQIDPIAKEKYLQILQNKLDTLLDEE